MGETKDYIHANFANVRVLMLFIEYYEVETCEWPM